MPDKKQRRIRSTVLVIACMGVFWVASMWLYQFNLSNEAERQIAATLKRTAAQECGTFGVTVERAFRVLESAALYLDTSGEADFTRQQESLQYCLSLSAPTTIWLAFADAEKADREQYLPAEETGRVLSGERVISGPIRKGNKDYFSIAVPVTRDGAVVAVLGCTAEAAQLGDVMRLDNVLREGYRMVIDDENRVISVCEEERDWWKAHGLLADHDTAASLSGLRLINTDELSASAEGDVYTLGKGTDSYYLTAVPLGINNWTLLGAVSQEIVQQEHAFSGRNLVVLNIAILIAFLLVLAFLFSIWGRERRGVQEERNRLAWLEERYRIVARESDDVIFEISLPEMLIEANENFHKLLGYNVVQWNSEYLSRVHPDDEQKFAAIYEGIRAGKRLMKEELRFRRADGTYIWCRLLIAILFDSKGKPARALGKITNIDSQKREAAWLRQKAQQDALTNLYNKETTHRMIRQFLETEGAGGVHGLMVLDVDNFKDINDTRGHLYGDAVLAAVADKLRMQFRSTDIVGRIGGDEFLVFLKNVNSRTQMEAQAVSLMQAFAAAGPDKELGYQIRCSIGAAAYPEDGVGIDQLFQNADSALYRAKRQGKGRYAMFRRDMDQPDAARSSLLGGDEDQDLL